MLLLQILFICFLSSISSSKLKSNAKLKLSICGPLCLECSEFDSSKCNVCKTGIYQYNNLCYNKCPDGSWADTEWQVCRPCDADCPICWGPRSDMCGSIFGVQTTVVLLENEVKNFFQSKPFDSKEVINWMNKLNVVLKKVKSNNIPMVENDLLDFQNEQINFETISPEDVYSSDKIEVELPIGSFSRNDGVFIPVPSYLDKEVEMITSHWIFIKGSWDGRNWNESWIPKLPTLIKLNSEKNKIYFENGGYWIYDKSRDWYWIKSNTLKESALSNEELIADLNTIKFDIGDFNTKTLKQKISLKKLKIEDNIKQFFDKFSDTNKLIFSKLIDTVKNEENSLLGSLDILKKKVKLYLGEEIILSKSGNSTISYPKSNLNLRKKEEHTQKVMEDVRDYYNKKNEKLKK